MAELVLTFNGHIPAKKNSRQGLVRGGRVMSLPSKAYSKWEKTELASLVGCPGISGPVEAMYEFWIGGKDSPRLFDLNNSVASINDLLVKAEIIDGDDWAVIVSEHSKVAGFIRGEPECRVTLRSANCHWIETIHQLRDKDGIKAQAKTLNVSQRAFISALWANLTARPIDNAP